MTFRKFKKLFRPIGLKEVLQLDNSKQAKAHAVLFDAKQPYRHIWTAIDGGGSDITLINGLHVCNTLFYVVCEVAWGDGSSSDKDVHIELEY